MKILQGVLVNTTGRLDHRMEVWDGISSKAKRHDMVTPTILVYDAGIFLSWGFKLRAFSVEALLPRRVPNHASSYS